MTPVPFRIGSALRPDLDQLATLLGKFDYEAIRSGQRRNFLLLQERLGNDHEPASLLADGICPPFLPGLAERKHAAAELLRQRGVGATELWNEEVEGLGASTPTVRYLRQSVLELPIHQEPGRTRDRLSRAAGARPGLATAGNESFSGGDRLVDDARRSRAACAAVRGGTVANGVHEIGRGDVEATCGLLSRLSVSFAGVTSPSLSRAICEDALRHEPPWILIAELDGKVAGVVVAVGDSRRFWRQFASRHPLLALRVLWGRRTRGGPKHNGTNGTHDGHAALAPPSQLAEVLFIGVAPERRRIGVADQLYARLFEQLRARHYRGIVSRIERDNMANLRMHLATGWTLHAQDDVFVATHSLG